MTEPLRIVTFKWGDKYPFDHVLKLRNMLRRHINLGFSYELVLISDSPFDKLLCEEAGIRYVPLWTDMRGTRNCGVRLVAFSSIMRDLIGPRFMWIDLDVVILADITPILRRSGDFIALSTPRPPMPYNGSMVMMDAGARERVLAEWTPEKYVRLGDAYGRKHGIRGGTVSDEGWMAIVLGDHEAKFTRDDGIYYFRHDLKEGKAPLPKDARIVIMNGRYDPSDKRYWKVAPWIPRNWR